MRNEKRDMFDIGGKFEINKNGSRGCQVSFADLLILFVYLLIHVNGTIGFHAHESKKETSTY